MSFGAIVIVGAVLLAFFALYRNAENERQRDHELKMERLRRKD